MDTEAIDHCTRRSIARREELGAVSLVRYGSAERGDFVPGVSDLDYFAVVEDGDVIPDLRELLRQCTAGVDYREIDIAWEYADNFPDPYAGIPFKCLTIYQADFRQHHTLVFGEDVFSDLPVYEFEDELPRRLDRIERLADVEAETVESLRIIAGECVRLRALVDGADSLRKGDVLDTLLEHDRCEALRLYRAYVEGEPIGCSESELRAFIDSQVDILREWA